MLCLSDKTVLDFVEGRARDAAPRIDEHIAVCAGCRELVAETAKFYFAGEHPSQLLTREQSVVTEGATPSMARSPDEALTPGTVVGRYQLVRPIGAGGMGVVYAAHDPALARTVALKLIRADLGANAGHLSDRLQREARALAKLSHPNVVHVYDTGVHRGQVFVAMEFVRGSTLRAWLRAQPRSWREVTQVLVQAGEGLLAAHAAGLVHRDFKPENVLRGDDGRVKVTDFGLARPVAFGVSAEDAAQAVDQGNESPIVSSTLMTLTRTGGIAGTPAYMSPEQLEGAAADARSDQFGFCVSFYEALYRARPFATRDIESLKRAVSLGEFVQPPQPADVPDPLAAILRRGLSASASERYPSMLELLERVKAVIADHPDSAASHEASVQKRRAPAVIAAVMIASMVLVAASFLFVRARAAPGTESTVASPPAAIREPEPPRAPVAPSASIAVDIAPPPSASSVPAPSASTTKRAQGTRSPPRRGKPTARPTPVSTPRAPDESALKPFDEGGR